MTAFLHLVCSGATQATRNAAFPKDEPLLEDQHGEATRLGAQLKRPARILRAPSQAAAQTAGALNEGFGMDVGVEPALADWNVGAWQGLALADLAARDPAGLEAWLTDPATSPHGGESLVALLERVGGWLAEAHASSGRTLAVSHAPVVRAALICVLQAPPQAFWRVDAQPLGRLDLTSDGHRWNFRMSRQFGHGQDIVE